MELQPEDKYVINAIHRMCRLLINYSSVEIETDKQYKDIVRHAEYTERLMRSRHYWHRPDSSNSESEEESELKSVCEARKPTEGEVKTIERSSGPVCMQQAAKTKEVSGC